MILMLWRTCQPTCQLLPDSRHLQGKEMWHLAAEQDVVEFLPLYAGCLDGQCRGAFSLDDMTVETGELMAVSLQAHHPYVEWNQRCFHTLYWDNAPAVFHAVKKVLVRFGVRAYWSHEPVEGVQISVDVIKFPRPPPPPPLPWEWCEGPVSYVQRILVWLLTLPASQVSNAAALDPSTCCPCSLPSSSFLMLMWCLSAVVHIDLRSI